MTSNVLANTTTKAPATPTWHIGLTPTFPSSLLMSDNATIDALLSDIPFLAVGLLGFAILTVLLVVRRFDIRTIPLFLSSILAFVAVVLDIDQLLVQSSSGTANTSNPAPTIPFSSVLPLLITREILLAISIGMRFLYIWIYLCYGPKHHGNKSNDREKAIGTRITSDPVSSSSYSKGSSISFLSFLVFSFKYVLFAFIFSIPILQLLWRLVKKFNRHGGVYTADSVIEIVVSAMAIMALVVHVMVDDVETNRQTPTRPGSGTGPVATNKGRGDYRGSTGYFAWRWRKVGKWIAFKHYIPVLFPILVGLGVAIGNLICFEFSESSLGRLLQSLELYIWMLYITISTFYGEGKEIPSPAKFEGLAADTEEKSKDQFAYLEERTPASNSSFPNQPDTPRNLLPTSAYPLTRNSSRPGSTRLASWLSSIRTNRDNDTDTNTGMLSMPSSSILSPSVLPKGRMSSWLSGNPGSARDLKSKSGLSTEVGGRIRSVSWDVFNTPLQGGDTEGDGATTFFDGKRSSALNQGVSDQVQMQPQNSLDPQMRPRLPVPRMQTPPLASRLERLAIQLNSIPVKGVEAQNETVLSPVDSTNRLSASLAFQPSSISYPDEFRLTPITSVTPELPRSSYQYNPDVEPNSYTPRSSYSYAQPVRSSVANSTTETELFLDQQRAELDKSVAELKYFQSEVVEAIDGTEGSTVSHGTWKESMTSDFLFSKFSDPPSSPTVIRQSDSLDFANEIEGRRSSSFQVDRSSFEVPQIHHYSPGRGNSFSFPSPIRRTSVDSSVLGVNEAALTLGLGLDLDGAVTRGELGTRQLDVTSFIATGGGRIDSSQFPFRPPIAPALSRNSLTDTEDGDGSATPTGSVVRFAKVVHVPPVASAPATITRSPSGSRNLAGSDTVNGSASEIPTRNFPQPGQNSATGIRPMRRKIGIGLPSSVKLNSTSNTAV